MKININKNAVGSRIKQIRLNKGYTLEAFGKLFGVSKSNVLKWEQGQSLPNKERLASISKIADMSVNELLYGSMDEFIENNFPTIHEYQTGQSSFSSFENYTDNLFFFRQWLNERNITLEDVNYIYDYLDQNTSINDTWDVDTSYLKTLEDIKINTKNNTALFMEIIEMLTDEDKKTLFKYTIERLKNYKISDEDRKLIEKNISNNYFLIYRFIILISLLY